MKTAILLIAVSLLLSACATPPPVSGSVESKFGGFRLLPDGRIEITVNPKSAK
ncbi:MAG: hypothetical protein WCP45_14730 [Verrucomicrobiota bacterium]